ncbi:MAG: sulfite exporter TauE/SafE family protein [Syntrophobacteraceae bacterium]|nr:sulfite exporter TauE/SafE family protein [Syntrophobacteraceae bacterium]
MKRLWLSLIVALGATSIMLYQGGSFAQQQSRGAQTAPPVETPKPEVKSEGEKLDAGTVFIKADKTALSNGGSIVVTGTAIPGKPVYLEVWSEDKVRASRFDADPDKETGKRPYILYMTHEMPAYYKIFLPRDMQGKLEEIKKEGSKWSVSQALKDLGADNAYSAPAKAKIDRYQATLLGSVMGSRGDLLPAMDGKETRRRSMQLVKARFRSPDKIFIPNVEVSPDGAYTARLDIDSGAPPGKFFIRAVVDKDVKSEALTVENSISFPNVYLDNAGTSVNLFGPFFLALAIAVFGVLMGAGGGFILNPLLVSLFPFPHTIVAGTVMPTVAFSQASGILNYSKIKFISWKLGTTIGIAMVAGAFIGPKLTELITLSQYKFIFGWILVILAGLMFWQTTPGYLSKNKKEQAILREFKKRAEEAARAK